MKRTLVWVIALAILLVAYVLYRARSNQLNIDPNAAKEIEKARRR
ncbi:MAG TPA: hypothetical protein VNV82_22395 [Bryobacteraceae bacterium]|nr:hypothetical protein [Bryobacteraceae bacterium]